MTSVSMTESQEPDAPDSAPSAEAEAAPAEPGETPAAEAPESTAEGLTEVVHERLSEETVGQILEAALQAAQEPLTVDRCLKLFRRGELPISGSETQRELLKRLLEALVDAFDGRGVELKRVASGYRLQVRQQLSPWVSRLWEEKPPRYSRALLETLSLIAYRQPVTRGDIEQVRGVAVSSNIIRTLEERGWIKEVGHREVPGRPALYGTTRAFLDYFNLKSLAELPPLEQIRELIEPLVVPEVAVPAAESIEGAEAEVAAEEAADVDAEAADEATAIDASAQDEAADEEAATDAEAAAETGAAGDVDAERPDQP